MKVAWPLAVIVVGVVVALIYFNERGIHELKNSGSVIVGIWTDLKASDGAGVKLEPHTLVSFWTPSPETAAGLRQAEQDGAAVPARDEWQRTITEPALRDFSKDLSRVPGVIGYRRFADLGKGRSFEKPGLWWQVTTGPEFRIDALRSAYRSFCHCEDMYLEVIAAGESQYHRLTEASAPANARR